MSKERRTQGERILELLRRGGGFVSSRKICEQLGVSRAAVWKQVRRLRERGFEIEGVSAVGYRLLRSPEALALLETDPGIETRRIGTRIVVKVETGSTNDDLWGLATRGAEEGTVVIAEAQRAGKGRRGRRWVSPGGKNLYLSVLLRPPIPPPGASLVTLMAAVALCATLEKAYGLRPRIKWPNDVLLEGKKTAGILAEMHAEEERIHFLVLGIGVNLNMEPGMFPPDLRYPATSVRMVLGRPVERVPFARKLLETLDHGYEDLLQGRGAEIMEAWTDRCAHPGVWLTVETAAGIREGRFLGLDEDGAMLLEVSRGRSEKVRAGDVVRVHLEGERA